MCDFFMFLFYEKDTIYFQNEKFSSLYLHDSEKSSNFAAGF